MKGYHRTIVCKSQRPAMPVRAGGIDYRKLKVPNKPPVYFGVLYHGLPAVAHMLAKPCESAKDALDHAGYVRDHPDDPDHPANLKPIVKEAAELVVEQEAVQEVAQPEPVLT